MSRPDEVVPDSVDVGAGRASGRWSRPGPGRSCRAAVASEDDANAVGTGITVAATSTATPIDTLIRVAVRRRFLTRSALGLKPDTCGSSRRPRCKLRRGEFVVCSPFLHQRHMDRHRRTVAQETSRCQQVSRCLQWKTFRSRSWGRGKPGVAGFRGPYRVGRGDHIRRSSGHTSKDIAKYLGVSRATLYLYLTDDDAA